MHLQGNGSKAACGMAVNNKIRVTSDINSVTCAGCKSINNAKKKK